jgi:hypothetical protein
MDSRANTFGDALLRLTLRMLPLLPAPEIYDVIRSVRRSQEDVDKQVQEAVDALSRSSRLIDNLGATLRERETKLRELQEESNRVSQLASLTAEQGEAVAASLEKLLGRTQTRERWIAFLINVVAGLMLFVFGVFASDWVKNIPARFAKQPAVSEPAKAPAERP